MEEGKVQGKVCKRRWPIVVGAIAIVVIAAGAGFAVWHEQPSFCNAICHEPMDSYVEGYVNDSTLMAHAHAQQDVTCLQCHEATFNDQITEGIAWLRGDFVMNDAGQLATVGVRADSSMCAKSGCHDFEEVKAATQDWGGQAGVNPHSSHQGEAIDCSNCHVAHATSYMYCNTCHDYEVPTGWSNPQ